jgi:hypothetical protein
VASKKCYKAGVINKEKRIKNKEVVKIILRNKVIRQNWIIDERCSLKKKQLYQSFLLFLWSQSHPASFYGLCSNEYAISSSKTNPR